MDLSGIAEDMGQETTESVEYILSLDVSPQQKKALLEKLLLAVGAAFYLKMFRDSSEVFDSTSIETLGYAGLEDQTSKLATKLLRNYALTRGVEWLGRDFFDSLLGKAEYEAFQNGKSLGKVPTLTRKLSGRENCKWCAEKAGTYTDPFGEDFARHRDCDCVFITKGFNSRNGVLKNYNKGGKNK